MKLELELEFEFALELLGATGLSLLYKRFVVLKYEQLWSSLINSFLY